jgi:hypothetical protein
MAEQITDLFVKFSLLRLDGLSETCPESNVFQLCPILAYKIQLTLSCGLVLELRAPHYRNL